MEKFPWASMVEYRKNLAFNCPIFSTHGQKFWVVAVGPRLYSIGKNRGLVMGSEWIHRYTVSHARMIVGEGNKDVWSDLYTDKGGNTTDKWKRGVEG